MDFGSQNDATAALMRTSQATVASARGKTVTTEVSEEKKALIDEIREKGFSVFLEEMQEKKREELREKILRSMGFSEDDLQKMPVEQRAQIEKMINQEIIERMVANAEMNGKTNVVLAQKSSVNVEIAQVSMTTTMLSGAGMGPLLALQEAEAEAAGEAVDTDEDAG